MFSMSSNMACGTLTDNVFVALISFFCKSTQKSVQNQNFVLSLFRTYEKEMGNAAVQPIRDNRCNEKRGECKLPFFVTFTQ